MLDKVEHLLDAAPAVAELLAACLRLTILATSRAPLRLRGEREYAIRGMLAQLQGDYATAIPLYRECTRLSRALRDTTALYFELAALAGALAMTGRGERAARLFGAAEALHERTGAVMPNPASRDLYARHLAALRARLDAATLAREWAAGRAMPLDEAIAEALDETQ